MAIISAIVGFVTPFVATGLGVSVATATAISQVGVGLLVSAAFAPKAPTIPPQEVQANINQAAAGRRRSYGVVLLGGIRVFFEAKDGTLHIVIVHHEGAISEVLEYWVDGQRVYLDGDGFTVEAGAGQDVGNEAVVDFIQIKTANGTQSTFPDLIEAFPDMWTADHRIEGSFTTYVRLKGPKPAKISKVFPKGANTVIQVKAKGVEVFDPRTGTTAYSANPALCTRDYMASEDGLRIAEIHFDDASIGTFATVCDVQGYEVSGTYDLNDEPRAVLDNLLRTCNGQPFMTPEGKIGLMGGQYSKPDVTIGADDILSIEWETGLDPMTDFNVLKGTYTSADHKFKEQEAPERRNETLLETQPERTQTLEIPWCPDGDQMQKLMQVYEARERPKFKATITTNLVGIKARFPKGDGIHTIRIDHPRIGGVYEVTSHGYSVADGTCAIGIRSIFDAWSNVVLKPNAPKLSDLNDNVQVGAVPFGLALSQKVITVSGEVSGVQIIAQVSDPGRADLQLVIEYRNAADEEWLRMNVGEGALRGVSGLVSEGTYDVRAYWLGEGVEPENYPEERITVISNPTVPDAPTNFVGSVSGSEAVLSWTNAPENYGRTRIFRNTTNSYAGATFVDDVAGLAGQQSTYTDTPGPGTYFYWAVTLNASLVPSQEPVPVELTIT